MPTKSPFPIVYTSRSGHECALECNYRRLIMYGYNGVGLRSVQRSVPLTTGICVHAGVEYLLKLIRDGYKPRPEDVDEAVRLALNAYKKLVKQARDLSIEGDAQAEFTYHEQQALTEALVRVWALREMRRIRRRYVVLEVERELSFNLTAMHPLLKYRTPPPLVHVIHESRLDALLREKDDDDNTKLGDLVAYSLKTQKMFNSRSEKTYQKDLQGPLEIWTAERHVREINNAICLLADESKLLHAGSLALAKAFARELDSKLLPDIVRQVSFCYLIKGEIRKAKDGLQHTYSPLIRGYRNIGAASIEYAHAYDWVEGGGDRWDPGATKRRLGKGWIPFNAWETEGGIAGWLELLATGTVQPEAGDPLMESVITPPEYFRDKGEVMSRVGQYAVSEQRICEELKRRQDKADPNASGAGLWEPDGVFEQNTQSCHFPTDCELNAWCWGDPKGGLSAEDIRQDPLASGLYEYRIPHHELEKEALRAVWDDIPF